MSAFLPVARTDAIGDAQFAILPVGAFEQHGAHLPLATDTIIACGIAAAIERRLGGLRLPPVTISASQEHAGHAGTVWISATTLDAVIRDILASLEHQGIRRCILVNAHGGNHVLANTAQEANLTGPRLFPAPSKYHWAAACKAAGIGVSPSEDMHAGLIETSLVMHLEPAAVAETLPGPEAGGNRSFIPVTGFSGLTRTGHVGTPAGATAETGAGLLSALVDAMADDIAGFLAMGDGPA